MTGMDVHFSSKTVDHGTPWDLFDWLDKQFDFRLDVCAATHNAKVPRFFDKDMDGLLQSWQLNEGAVWCNPPYGREITQWVEKAHAEALKGQTVVMLLPARTDTAWWHNFIWDREHHQPQPGVEVRLLRGRLKFLRPDGTAQDAAPFPSAVVIFHGTRA